MSKISERILEVIKQKNISYGELSKLTDIPKSALQRYATGETEKIPLDRLEKIALVLGVSAEYLMGWDEDAPSLTLGEKIKGEREFRKVSQEELAAKLGLPLSELVSYESNETIPSAGMIHSIAEALGIRDYYLLNGDALFWWNAGEYFGLENGRNSAEWLELLRQSQKTADALRSLAEQLSIGVVTVGEGEEKSIVFKDRYRSKQMYNDEHRLLLTILQINEAQQNRNMRTLRILAELVSVMSPEDQKELLAYAEFKETMRQKQLGISVKHPYQYELEDSDSSTNVVNESTPRKDN